MSEVLIPVMVTAIGAIVVELVRRSGQKGSREIALIQEIQEERDRDRERLDALTAKVDALMEELARLRGREFLWRFHTGQQDAVIRAAGADPVELPAELKEQI